MSTAADTDFSLPGPRSAADDFDTPSSADTAHLIPRDRFDRPQVVTPEGKAEYYQRVTTFVGMLEEQSTLSKWKDRMTALGLARRPDLVLRVHAVADPTSKEGKAELERICEDAKTAAGANVKRDSGTAIHKLVETYKKTGKMPPGLDSRWVHAYLECIKPLRIIAMEQFVVLDEYKVAGTFDMLAEHDAYPGYRFILDLKTGNTDYGNKIGMQLAAYARGELYDPVTHARSPHGANRHRAFVIDLDTDAATCRLRPTDIAAATAGLDLCHRVREWRRRKDFYLPANPQ